MERGFVAYSEGRVDGAAGRRASVPRPAGELHIKYGAIRGDDVFVVKMATGFYATRTAACRRSAV